jgi:glutamyl/glutaminyl-tRNA synthetase
VKKTRIAPTPSGFLHVGNIFSFTITVAMARRTGASVLLRIDDLDRERVTRAYVQDIFDTLRFLGIPWDEGPADADEFEKGWSQVHRMDLYTQALEQLRDSGALFACTCSRSQVLRDGEAGVYPGTCRDLGLPLETAKVNWRLRTSAARTLSVKTFPRGRIDEELPREMQDLVVRKRDGFPAYQLASLVDDLYFGIDLIVRGQDLWPSTLAQHYLSYPLDAAAFREATFFHHPLLLTATGEKQSKSAGDTSIQQLRKQGLKPEAIYSRIARLLGREDPVRNWEELAVLADLFWKQR